MKKVDIKVHESILGPSPSIQAANTYQCTGIDMECRYITTIKIAHAQPIAGEVVVTIECK